MKFLKFLIPCLVSVTCFSQKADTDHLETILFQKTILSELTGVTPINDGDTYLSERSAPKERKLTADYLVSQLNTMGLTSEGQIYTITNSNLFLDLFYAPVKGINVVAQLSATIPSNTYVILGAHYDTERTSPGAIDNATGIALILDVVHKLSALKIRNVNFMVVFFDQEEDNEVGSKAFVKTLKKTSKKVHSVHIVDLIGWDSNGNKKIALQSPSVFLEQAYQKSIQDVGMLMEVIGGASSDNKSFLEEGYQTVLISDEVTDVTPYYHSPKDDIITVDFDYLALTSEAVFKTLKNIALEN